MATALLHLLSWWRRAPWLFVAGVVLAIYFGYHGLIGSRGLLAWQELSAELASTRQDLDRLRAERIALEEKVGRLRSSALDADLIDELARRHLSLVDPLDVIILLDDQTKDR